ncbi:two-component system response regulator CreB [Uliginosibacterium sp. sgz301328]|uniref:two-component system response regulator CreB n=1 Tax=Uliginosibacterium sp. sgz301328 TaxID=3243764 RepID=UPI00359DD6CB
MSNILIVEDEAPIAETLAYALRAEGYATAHVATGQAALARLAEGNLALAIIDVGLPDISGFELVRRIRSSNPIPVMFLTAHADEIDRVLGFEVGADDYVVKPFSPREVAGRVRAILRRTTSMPAQAIGGTSSVWQHDASAASIRYHGAVLSLTRYEYLLLAWLIRHPSRVFSREQLLEAVWNGAHDGSDRTVDTHIKTLRAKLRSVAPDDDPIQTHRGMGYSLQAPRAS